MSQKDILVVGGRSGIGAKVVEVLEIDARDLYVTAPDPMDLDITNELQIQDYLEAEGPFSHIVYTPGVARLKWAKDLRMDDYVEDFKVNAFGFGLLLAEHRRNHPDYNFSAVAIVSDAMYNPMRGSTTYCASKAALAGIIRNLAREWAPHCRVNGVAPAIVADTPMTNYIDATVPGFRGWDPEKAAAYEASLLPMGRRITKVEVAQVVRDVLFGPAYQTGTIVDITGGK